MLHNLQHLITSSPTLQEPLEERPIGSQTNEHLDIARPSQSFFEGAQYFRMRDFQYFNANHVTVNPPPNLGPVDGV